MALTKNSVGLGAADCRLAVKKKCESDLVIALAGNPNVGKSTVFNELTGMRQHTGNWPGKTVANAQGYCERNGVGYVLVDIPGTYSLMAHSVEEEVARDFICFGGADAVIVVCDATCLERNMNLVLQTIEITPKTVVCVNLMDEAKKKGIRIDLDKLSGRLGVPVVGTAARRGDGLPAMLDAVKSVVESDGGTIRVVYAEETEQAVSIVESAISEKCGGINARWLAARLIDGDSSILGALSEYLGRDLSDGADVAAAVNSAKEHLAANGFTEQRFKDDIVSSLVHTAEEVCTGVVQHRNEKYNLRDRKLDYVFTSKWTGFPIMFLLLAAVFWITVTGANYPSELLGNLLFGLGDTLYDAALGIRAPIWLCEVLFSGVYRVLAWVIAVMLPPMAIFFPLFTLLEDFGYLPRVAFNLDKIFKKCRACGKQSLTMCMGFGCNAAGVVGCRIIDSPRERLIAMLTNNFAPCNGRFPTLIAIITMFFLGSTRGAYSTLLSALLLSLVIVLGIIMTFLTSRILSATLLSGVPSSFTLELPPYRRPQIGRVIVRSLFDRTAFVLGRAAAVAAPAGLVIWAMANITLSGATLLTHCADFLNPFAQCLGLDGIILMAFILGFPANEIVIPIVIMAYMAQGSLIDLTDLSALRTLLVANGWTWVTAVSTMLFSLMHWPCSTTLLTIKQESQSARWTLVAFIIPTVIGMLTCFVFASIAHMFI